MVLHGIWGWQSNISYISVSSESVPMQLKDISMLYFCFRLYLLLGLSSLSVAAQLFLSFQRARLGETCCLPALNIPMAIEPESGATLF